MERPKGRPASASSLHVLIHPPRCISCHIACYNITCTLHLLPHRLLLHHLHAASLATSLATTSLARCISCHITCHYITCTLHLLPHHLLLHHLHATSLATSLATISLARCISCHITCHITLLHSQLSVQTWAPIARCLYLGLARTVYIFRFLCNVYIRRMNPVV